jgi:uncharacterized protein YaiI (UPF0178 family)
LGGQEEALTVYLDGDSCPKPVRELVARSCRREKIDFVCFANRPIPFEETWVTMKIVEGSLGAADDAIVANATPGDLVMTRDIPLAARLVEKGVSVVNDRGTIYSRENVRERLSLRDFMEELRTAGLKPESTASYGTKEWNAFVRSWDKEFMRLLRQARSKV